MAATKVKKQNTGPSAGNGAGSLRGRIPSIPDVDDKPSSQGPSGYVFVLILFALVFALILPLVGFLYVDTMVTKREAKAQMEKVEKLRKQIEDERKKDANPVLIPHQLPDGRTPKNP
jgi:hypothetical protein